MTEYTYEDVIIDPNDPRVEIGAYYYFGDNAPSALYKANQRGIGMELVYVYSRYNFDGCSIFRLRNEGGEEFPSSFIIRKKKPSYEERQAKWIKTNSIKVGDKVKIIKEFDDDEDFDYGWDDEMKDLVGTTGEIKKINNGSIQVYTENKAVGWFWPYDCLEKIEEPKFKVGDFVKEKETGLVGVITEKTEDEFAVYQNCPNTVLLFEAEELEPAKAHIKPFNLSDPRTRDKIRGCWIRKKDNSEIKLIWWLWELDGKWMIDEDINPQELLNDWVFEDGSPCGIVVEDEQ